MKTTWLLTTLLLLALLAGCTAAPDVAGDAAPAPATASSGAGDQLAVRWDGLSLDDFYAASFGDLTLRYPETVVELGLTEVYGVSDVELNDLSDDYDRATYALIAAILDKLETYDRAALSPDEQISYDIYQWYLQDLLNGEPYRLYEYPATYYFVTSQPEQTIMFFTDIHPVSDLQDARDYVTRLTLVGTKIDQLIEGLALRAEAGITPPAFAVQWEFFTTFNDLNASSARNTAFYTTLESKLEVLPSISASDKQAVLADAEAAIQDVVLPAYRRLSEYMRAMDTYSGGDSGVWRLPDGGDYYAQQLHHFTTTELSAEEIHDLGLAELERIHADMRTLFDQLGYPQDESLVQLYDRVAADGGARLGEAAIAGYEDILDTAQANLGDAFNTRSVPELAVIGGPSGGYYVPGSFDGTRPGAFYASLSNSTDYYTMPSLAYHEGIPGHHFQISIAHSLTNLPAFRQGLNFNAFVEGWALYAEHLASELGWYEGDPYGDLGRLQFAAFRAARLVVDTGLHADGWTFDEAQAFFTENTGFEVGDNVNPQNEIARYDVWPGQATAYYVGYLKIMELRQQAMDQLGDAFDLKEFHDVVLNNGAMPLEILERVVQQYIADTLAANS